MDQKELLEKLENELRELLEMVRSRLADQPLEALQLRRDIAAWNALECIAHLNIFLDMYLPRIERSIHLAKARRWAQTGQGARVSYTWVARRVLRIADVATGKPRRTPKRYDLIHQPMGKEVLKTFLINSERLLRNIQAVKEVDLNRPKIGWGPSGFFKMTLGNMLEWLVRHGQRHVLQATRNVG